MKNRKSWVALAPLLVVTDILCAIAIVTLLWPIAMGRL